MEGNQVTSIARPQSAGTVIVNRPASMPLSSTGHHGRYQRIFVTSLMSAGATPSCDSGIPGWGLAILGNEERT